MVFARPAAVRRQYGRSDAQLPFVNARQRPDRYLTAPAQRPQQTTFRQDRLPGRLVIDQGKQRPGWLVGSPTLH